MLKSNRFRQIAIARTVVLLLAIGTGLGGATGVAAQSSDGSGATQGPFRLRQPTAASQQRDIDCSNPYAGTSTSNRQDLTESGNGSVTSAGYGSTDRSGSADAGYQASRSDSAMQRDRDPNRSAESKGNADDRLLAREPVDTFEAYLRKMNVYGVKRFGYELVTPQSRNDCLDGNTVVPPDYAVSPGDELVVNMWGSVDADLRLVVDRTGRINIPRVGPVMVAGVRYSELPALISQRAEKVFKNFQVSVTLGQLRSVRIYVTGYVKRPGAYTVNSLSTIVAALMKAGGPSSSGSFRNIELKRGKATAASFDLYDLLIKGDRAADRMIQADDVVHVGPVGSQVAVVGAVNKPAIFEIKATETIGNVLDMAGGLGAVADRSRLAVERLVDRASNRVTQLALPESLAQPPANGDVFRAFSAVDAVLPVAQQNKRVRIEGEVARPGDYVLPPASSIEDAIASAGGMTPAAYVFGSEFTRETVRISQQENYERALRDLETEFARASTQRALNADEAAAQTARASATQRLVERLRAVKPTGRIVLQIPPTGGALPNLALEDGDRLYIPAKPTSVGVFGSVYNGGSYLYGQAKSVDDFLALAGGPTKGADSSSTFVLRANGSVVSNAQKARFFGYVGGLKDVSTEPGDTIFVPEEINKTTWTQDIKEWTQILYQFAIGAAAFKTLSN